MALPIISFLSLGIHVGMFTKLSVPYPDLAALPPLVRSAGVSFQLLGIVWFCSVAFPRSAVRSVWRDANAVGWIMVFLLESFKTYVFQVYLTDGWRDWRWFTLAVDQAPDAIFLYYLGAAGAVLHHHARGRLLAVAAGAIAVALLGVYALEPALAHLGAMLKSALSLATPSERYQLPYPYHVYFVMYASFAAAVLAVYAMVRRSWCALSGSPAVKAVVFMTMMLVASGRASLQLLYSAWVPLPYLTALLSVSQFTLEYAVLALLSAALWSRVSCVGTPEHV